MKFLLLIFLVLSGLHTASAETLQDNPKLRTNVTISAKGLDMAQVMQMLSEQTKVKLKAPEQQVADYKLTVFVDNQPAYKVMGGIARLYGLIWKATRDGFDVLLPADQATLDRESKSATWAKLRAVLDETVEFARRTDDEVEKLRLALGKRTKEIGKQEHPRDITELLFQRTALAPDVLPSVRFYGSIPKDAQDAIWAGDQVWFSTASPEPKWAIKEPFKPIEELHTKYPTSTFDIGFMRAESDDMLGVYAHIEANDADSISGFAGGRLCAIRWLSVPPLPQQLDMPALQKKIELTPNELVKEANLPHINRHNDPPTVNRSDLLSLVHRKTGLQIVSDHITYYFKGGFLLEGTPIDMVKASSNFPWDFRLEWGGDGTFAYVRAKKPLQAQSFEVPSRVVNLLRKALVRRVPFSDPAQNAFLRLTNYQRGRMARFASVLDLSPYAKKVGQTYIYPKSDVDFAFSLSPVHLAAASQGWLKISQLTDEEKTKLPFPSVGCTPTEPRQPYKIGIWRDGVRVDGPMVIAPQVTAMPVAFRVDITADDLYSYVPLSRNPKTNSSVPTRRILLRAGSLRELELKVRQSGVAVNKSFLRVTRYLRIQARWMMLDGQVSERCHSLRLEAELPPKGADSATNQGGG
ncbi:MAG: hypothetical protein WCL39_04890 [Armatimonadota bacterium]